MASSLILHTRLPRPRRGPIAPGAVRASDEEGREAENRPLSWDLVRWLCGYTRPYAFQRNVLLALVVLRSLQLAALAWAIGWIINGPIASRSTSGLAWGCAGFLLLTLITQVMFHFRYRLALELGEAVVHDLRKHLFAHLQRMQLDFFNRTRLGTIISRMNSDVEAVRIGVQDVVFVSLVAAGQMLAAGALMAWYDPLLFGVVAAMAPVIWVLNRHFRRQLSHAHREMHESFSRVTSSVAESIQGIQVTQGSGRQELNTRQFRELVADHAGYNMLSARMAGRFVPLLELNTQFFLAVVLVLGGYRVLTPGSSVPPGNLIQFLFLANLFFGPIQTIGDQYNQALMAMAGAERVRQFLAVEPTWIDPPQARAVPRLSGGVQFEHVSFAYEPGRSVLHDVSFTAPPGQTVALVGHTGSGKTSIINLLAKFYLPTAGVVRVDGADLTHLGTDSLRRQMGIVLQQNFLFSGSVLENIRLARPEATDDQVRQALEELGCLDLFQALPEGLCTEGGESGNRLSLGQRQLVCFARAMLADPRILILDEATSSVDVFTEHRVQQALARLLAGRTSFVVAHRLSTIRRAHQVLVLDAGRIVERGTHEALLARGGTYAALHRSAMHAKAA